MSLRRRIIMARLNEKPSNKLIDYFKNYKVNRTGYANFPTSWIGCRLKIEKPRNDIYSDYVSTIANLNSDNDEIDYIPIQAAIGYDPSKDYNLRIKLVNKNLIYQDELKRSGLLYFGFEGLNGNSQRCYKTSQELSPEEFQKGTEFIIPINSGEFLNNLTVHYYIPRNSGYSRDSYTFTLMFEFYFEEITE